MTDEERILESLAKKICKNIDAEYKNIFNEKFNIPLFSFWQRVKHPIIYYKWRSYENSLKRYGIHWKDL